jgi:hypothetical protein
MEKENKVQKFVYMKRGEGQRTEKTIQKLAAASQ